jgi:glycosyltransferase involved in cell wall biosynthesis
MRILFISGWYPYPPDNGARIRVFNLIKHLAAQNEITLFSFSSSPEPVSQERLYAMSPYCRSIAAVPYKEFEPGRLRALLALLSTRPRSIVDTYSPEMAALVKQAIPDTAFDVVVASTLRAAPYVLSIEGIPRVFEEIEVAVLHEKFAYAPNLAARIRYGLMWWKQSRYIGRLLFQFDGCTVVSEQERDLVLGIVPNYHPLTVVPNGVDLQANTGDFGAPKPDTLIYSGALTYSANFDAMEFFMRDIFPQVKAQRSNAHLRITGGYDGTLVERLPLGDGAELTGYLDDIRPAVAQSWACVVPLRVGGGTRLKILEAMALGTPVISTSKGAEGLEVAHEKNVLIADNPNDFAQAVLRVLKDKTLRVKLSANGRRLVEERYSWEMCTSQLEQLLCQVVEQTHNTNG